MWNSEQKIIEMLKSKLKGNADVALMHGEITFAITVRVSCALVQILDTIYRIQYVFGHLYTI